MALKATIYKAELEVADLDRGHYASHALTLARHPSETEQRLMIRLLAFAMHAHEDLEFGRGLSTDDEPDLWLKDATGEIQLWIDVGLPDERRLRKAAGRTRRLVLIGYGERALAVWWKKNREALARLDKLAVWSLSDADAVALEALAARNMELQCTIDDGQISVGNGDAYLSIGITRLQDADRD
ncbi:MAG: YaeQ family protein [Pseudomonadales bacterium]